MAIGASNAGTAEDQQVAVESRLLAPQNNSVTLDTMARAAGALGKRVIIRVADLKAKPA